MKNSDKIDILWQKLNGKIFLNPLYIPLFFRYRVVRGAASSGWGSYYATRKNLTTWVNSGSRLSFRTYCITHGYGDRRRKSGKKGEIKRNRIGGVFLALFFGVALAQEYTGNIPIGWIILADSAIIYVCYEAVAGLFADGGWIRYFLGVVGIMLVPLGVVTVFHTLLSKFHI